MNQITLKTPPRFEEPRLLWKWEEGNVLSLYYAQSRQCRVGVPPNAPVASILRIGERRSFRDYEYGEWASRPTPNEEGA
ncbi:MAG: hypothetical protein CML13_02440 [Puniceicoccaceae bacterium]|nr:hypothetical protein [Puniceicoccaceae bacterium]